MSQTKIDLSGSKALKPPATEFMDKLASSLKTSEEYVIGYSTKSSGDNLITDHLLSIGASLQNSDSLQITTFDKKLTKNDHASNAQVMQEFADFIKKVEKKTCKLTLVSNNPCRDNPWIDLYFERYKIRKPINYVGIQYRDIMDLSSIQKTIADIKDEGKLKHKYLEVQSVLDEARLTANNYNKTVRLLKKTSDAVKPTDVLEKKYPLLFPRQHPPINTHEYRFLFHVETSGYSYTENGLLAIAACICDFEFNVIESHTIHFQLEKGQVFNPSSVYWFINREALNLINTNAKLPELGIAEFAAFYKRVVGQYNPRFMSDNPAFHVGWIHYMFAKYNINLSLTKTETGDLRHIYDITSQQKMLQMLTGENELTIEEISKLKNDDHITLNKLVKMAHFESKVREMYPVLEQSFIDSALISLKEYKATTVFLLENNTRLYPELISIIFNYLFICGNSANHLHEHQDNDDFFDGLAQIEQISKRIVFSLDQVVDPFYSLALGGGKVLNFNPRPAHRVRKDFDFVMTGKTPQTRLKSDAQTLLNFKKTLFSQLKALSLPVTESDISYWDGISFFYFNLSFILQTQVAVLKPKIELSFIYFPDAFFLPMPPLNIGYLQNTAIKNIVTLNLIDIFAGKIIAFVVCDGIFRPQKAHRLFKNFFDIYMLSLFPEIDIKSKQFMDAIYRRMCVNLKMNKENCPEFCNDPLKMISDALDALRNNRNNQFGEGSEFARHYYTYIRKYVYRCKAHTFTDSIKVIIQILTGFLNHLNYNAIKYKTLFECAYDLTFWNGKPKLNSDKQPAVVELVYP